MENIWKTTLPNLVMTNMKPWYRLFNITMWYRWPIEIDGLPFLKMNGDVPWRTVKSPDGIHHAFCHHNNPIINKL
jgi:hypothetical protein